MAQLRKYEVVLVCFVNYSKMTLGDTTLIAPDEGVWGDRVRTKHL